jgi:caa(3)-type oxidase subunit IV
MRDADSASVGVQVRRLVRTWLAIVVLGALELAASFLPLAPAFRPCVMIPGVLMILGVAIGFMEVRQGPAIVRAFAIGAVFWLAVLLALGSADPLTRVDYPVAGTRVE